MLSRYLSAGLVVAALALAPPHGHATVPGSIEVTCDVGRTAFRTAARLLPAGGSVTFHVYSAPTGGTEINPPGYDVLLADLQVFKAFTEKYDSVSKRKAARIDAGIGSDATPVLLPANGMAYLELEVGTSTLGCDFAATGSLTARRRLQSVPFARECETCQATADISVRVYRSTALLVPIGVNTSPVFDTERWDTDNMFDLANASRLTAQTAGKYLIYAWVVWAGTATGSHALEIRRNGAALIVSEVVEGATGPAQGTHLNVSTHYELAAADYVEVTLVQHSGAPLNANEVEFGMVKLP